MARMDMTPFVGIPSPAKPRPPQPSPMASRKQVHADRFAAMADLALEYHRKHDGPVIRRVSRNLFGQMILRTDELFEFFIAFGLKDFLFFVTYRFGDHWCPYSGGHDALSRGCHGERRLDR